MTLTVTTHASWNGIKDSVLAGALSVEKTQRIQELFCGVIRATETRNTSGTNKNHTVTTGTVIFSRTA